MNYSNPTIARLLAKENLSVQHGNYKTAWFDVKNRVLGLPMWKDMGKDVYDLLVGHEVGHALYTPYEGWHDTPEKIKGVPRSYMNVIEDARIERFIQNTYPGLVGPFKRGYYILKDEGIFQIPENVDWNKIKLIDKINLKAKLADLIDVPFNDEEKEFYNKARYQTQTFEEVVELCKEILVYTQENTPELITKPEPEENKMFDSASGDMPESVNSDSDTIPDGHDDYLPGEEQDKDSINEGGSTPSDGDEPAGEESSNDEESSPDEEGSETTGLDKGEGGGDVSLTDDAHRKAERNLLDGSNGIQSVYIREPSKAMRDHVMFSFKEVHQSRLDIMKAAEFDIAKEGILRDYKGYLAQVKKASNFAVKEFEMRKAGYQWQRAQTARSGTLDINKVYSYKYNDDIFARVTKLANAKNHGMIMMIDYSGSMGSTLSQVIDQLFHLVTFCKMVNIPFDVYAFTSGNNRSKGKILLRDGDLDMSEVSLPLLISSSLKKKEYTQALEGLYMKKLACACRNNQYFSDDPYWNDYSITGKMEFWGSTPLNHVLVLGHKLVKNFKMKHNIDKMNLVVLSDGDSNRMNSWNDISIMDKKTKSISYASTKMHIDGKLLEISSNNHKATHGLLKNISKRYGCKTIGFFISDRGWDFNSKLHEADIWDHRPASKEYRKNKCVSLKNAVGYDEFYLVKGGKNLDATSDEFEVASKASTAQIKAGFRKFSASKKKNKVLLTNFGKAVA